MPPCKQIVWNVLSREPVVLRQAPQVGLDVRAHQRASHGQRVDDQRRTDAVVKGEDAGVKVRVMADDGSLTPIDLAKYFLHLYSWVPPCFAPRQFQPPPMHFKTWIAKIRFGRHFPKRVFLAVEICFKVQNTEHYILTILAVSGMCSQSAPN